jgi:hypothetical protein
MKGPRLAARKNPPALPSALRQAPREEGVSEGLEVEVKGARVTVIGPEGATQVIADEELLGEIHGAEAEKG